MLGSLGVTGDVEDSSSRCQCLHGTVALVFESRTSWAPSGVLFQNCPVAAPGTLRPLGGGGGEDTRQVWN